MEMPPIVQVVRSLDDEYYLISEVAAALDVPVNTLPRLARKDPKRWGWSKTLVHGKLTAHLYTPADVRKLARYFQAERDRHPSPLGRQGRPRIWTQEEVADRQSRYNQACRLRRQAKELKATDPLGARQLHNRSRILVRTLRAEAKARKAQLTTR